MLTIAADISAPASASQPCYKIKEASGCLLPIFWQLRGLLAFAKLPPPCKSLNHHQAQSRSVIIRLFKKRKQTWCGAILKYQLDAFTCLPSLPPSNDHKSLRENQNYIVMADKSGRKRTIFNGLRLAIARDWALPSKRGNFLTAAGRPVRRQCLRVVG